MDDLSESVFREDFETARYLLEKKCDVEYTPEYQQSPLQSAASRGNIKMMKLLLEYKADVNAKNSGEGKAALTRAAIGGKFDAVVFLVENGADVNTCCSFGTTPLKAALFNGRILIARYLIKKGAGTSKEIIDVLVNIVSNGYLVAGFLYEHYPSETKIALKSYRGIYKGLLHVGQKYHICYESIVLFCLWFNKTHGVKDISRKISKEVWSVMPDRW